MAIKMQKEFNNGMVAEYWRIKEFKVINGSSHVLVKLDLWKDLATREEENKSPAMEYDFEIDLDSTIGIVFSNCYDKLKLLEQFQGAVDV